MMKRHDLSIFVVISLVLHALFFAYMLQWVRTTAQARPSYNVIKVSIVQGAPRVKPMAIPARTARSVRPVVLPKPLSSKPLPQEKKTPAPEQDIPQAVTQESAAIGEPTGATSASGTVTGTSAAQAGAGGDPAGNAAANEGVIAERAFANARDAYIMELYAMIKKHFAYPALARRRGQEGRVQLRFVIGDNGRAQNIEVVASSGYYLLDRAAVDTIRSIPLQPPPRRAMEVPITIVYRLEDER